MYIIAGLGNPTAQYAGTRHNVGFAVIDVLSAAYGIAVDTRKFNGLIGRGMIGSERVLLVKPQTYMNASGECLREVLNYFKEDISRLIVIVDDINLEPGQLRIRGKGSAGGHNGLKSIISQCGSQDFARIRVGIGEKNPRQDLADYVLSHFSGEEREQMDAAYSLAAKAVRSLMEDGLEAAMNLYNRKVQA